MPSGPSYRRWLWAILALALAVRLLAGIWWQERLPAGKQFGFPDSESYWELGRRIAQGKSYEFGPEQYAIFRTPGYPILLAGLFLLDAEPSVMCGRALSAVLGTIAVAGVASLARQLFDRRTALVAAGIAAFYPEAIALSTFVLSEAPFCPLMVWQLVAWTKAWKADFRAHAHASVGRGTQWAAIAGILGGLATLMRPSWLLFAPFALFIGLAIGPERRKQALIGGVLLTSLAMTMIPWWARNYLIAGRFVPTTLQVGASLYDGLSPTATGASDMRFVPRFVAEQKAADAQTAIHHGTFEDRLDRRMRDAALDWGRENPGRVATLAWVKLRRIWSPIPNAAEFGGGLTRLVLTLTYTPVIVLAAIGAWRYVRRDWPYALCVLPAIYFTCLHVVFVSSIRYRQPAMLVLIVLAAAVASEWVFARMRARERETERQRDGGTSQ
ncbi:MAG: glycosyltransferase family 39 protein [Planctomycetaceae bacterium]|nr:glycosyltransferase family 39 protein [Planctomycetaceae bacterium]